MSPQNPPATPEGAIPIPATLVDLLVQRAEQRRDRLAFTFSRDGEDRDDGRATYLELDDRARRIAADLIDCGAAGQAVLVLCQPGVDFAASFFGCLYAGAVAIPVHPPMREHLLPRVQSIIADLKPGFALATADVAAKIRGPINDVAAGVAGRHLDWVIADAPRGDAAAWTTPEIGADSIAMIQYTSGSTSAPKGVMLSHGNLIHNCETIRQAWGSGFNREGYGVFWLPPYHDMGLIGGLLGTLYVGGSAALMPPSAFIKRPMRWLEAISRYRAEITAAPNFAYDLAVALSTPEERAALDLSNWKAALCGAEPVRTATMKGFAEAFAPAGFRPEAILPVYGLAEATLLVSGGNDTPLQTVRRVDRAALGDNRVVDVNTDDDPTCATLVGCGLPRGGQRVAIVDPDTRLECPPDRVGEIWVRGPSVAQGYWGAPELSAEIFRASIADTGEGPFLRSGDLGFIYRGEVFIAGRRKDLIIIHGVNHYPNDIELTVQNCNPGLLRGRGAVIAVADAPGADERLVVVQEVDPSRFTPEALDELMPQIRAAITEHHAVRASAIVLVAPLQLPTTSSGKIQRSSTKKLYVEDSLPVVSQWPTKTAAPHPEAAEAPAERPVTESPAQAPEPADHPARSSGPRVGADEIAEWLITQLAQDLELPAEEIDQAQPFAYYGLDSVHAIRLTAGLEKLVGCELTPTLAYEYPTIELLAAHVAALSDETATAGESHEPGRRPPVDEPIAIIGIGCRFPGADGPEKFWEMLSSGVDATSEVPAERWDVDAFYNPDPSVPGTAISRRGGFLNDVAGFDHKFFGISPREAQQMDPQQRLLLEVAWEALEDAGQVPDQLAGGRTGVFVGISTNDYVSLRSGHPEVIDAYTGTGNSFSIAANRLSYVFDFNGPSMAIDTACSSSLVAVDLACRALRDGECSTALAGGVNVILSPALAINFTKARVMAPDGRCKTFDAHADGYVRGEGAGIVVLKPLSRAVADADRIYAVLRGIATNSDGRTNGLIAPSGRAQRAVLTEAYRQAGLTPGAVQYIEAHGTGTALGDAIEANALGEVLAEGRTANHRALIGSVKTNIGHLEAAAGIAGLIKVALALRHRAVPPSLNYTAPNPHIDFDKLPLEVVQTLTPWPAGARAVAGVSSFGFGGTNAHAVLTEAPQARLDHSEDGWDTPDSARPELLPLSARSPEALLALAGEYERALLGEASLADLCYTAAARRGHHAYRLAAVGDSPAAMFESLAAYRQKEARPGLSHGHCRPGHPPRVTFIFSGQGSQWLGMARGLHAAEPVFAEALTACDAALAPHLGHSVLADLVADGTRSGPEDPHGLGDLSDIGVLQPAIFAIQVALAALWRSWGVEPAAVVGHSMGEVAAAHVAGALSLDDAARVICARGRMLRHVRGQGAMMVAEATVAEAEQLIGEHTHAVSVAASNSLRSTVLAGDRAVLAEMMADLEARERFCRWIDVDVASHSPQMEPLRSGLRAPLVKLQPKSPTVPLYSTVTGDLLADRPMDAEYWVENLRSPVQFSSALRRLLEAGSHTGNDVFIELSPHPILLIAVREDAEDLGCSPTLLASMRRDDAGRQTALGSVGALYTLGHPVRWPQIYPPQARCVAAPTYPWQRQRAWLDVGPPAAAPRLGAIAPAGGGPVWRGPIRSAAHPDTALAEVQIGTGLVPQLADHQIRGVTVMPVALLLRLIQAGAAHTYGYPDWVVRDVELHRMVEFTGTESHTVQLVFRGDPAGTVSVQCYVTRDAEFGVEAPAGWSLLATAEVSATGPGTETAGGPGEADVDSPDTVLARCGQEVAGEPFYRRLADGGVAYGPAFRTVQNVRRRDGEAIAELDLRAGGVTGFGSTAETVDIAGTAILDACFQALAAALPRATTRSSAGTPLYLPSGLAELDAPEALAGIQWAHAILRSSPETQTQTANDPNTPETLVGDVCLRRADGAVVAAARGLRLHRLSSAAMTAARMRDRIYRVRWEPAPTPNGAWNTTVEPGSWLVFSDGGTLGADLVSRLRSHDQSCVVVEPADGEFQRLGPDDYRIDPTRPDQFQRLLAEVFAGDRPPGRGMVHLWALRDAPTAQTSSTSLHTAGTLGPLSVLYLLQAMSARSAGGSADEAQPPRLWLVTAGAQFPEDPRESAQPTEVSVAQATLWGMARSIDHEHPELRCTCLDVGVEVGPDTGPDAASSSLPTPGETVFREVWSGLDTHDEPEVALRGDRRYVSRLTRYRLAASTDLPTAALPATSTGDRRPSFDPAASYLITGGLGAVGLVVAEWLVDNGAAHIVLLGRSAASPAAQEKLAALRDRGAEVIVTMADVTDAAQLGAVLGQIDASMPPLRGVIHAAGIVDIGGIIERLDEQRLRSTMAPKVQGAWNLHALTQDTQLDFFVMFSSVSAVLGSPGASNYTAANAFLDALAWHRHAEGRPALAIDWGPWAQLGRLDEVQTHERFRHYGVEALPAGEYLAALALLMHQPAPQVAVLDIDWTRWRPDARSPLLSGLRDGPYGGGPAADGSQGGSTSRILEEVRDAEPAERQRRLDVYLAGLVAAKLGLSPTELDIDAPLNTLGVDSLITLELRIQVEQDLGVVVPVARLLDGPSVTGLSAWLAGQIAQGAPPAPTPLSGLAARRSTMRATTPESGATRNTGGASTQGIDLLTQVADLSDEAVDALLREMTASGNQATEGRQE